MAIPCHCRTNIDKYKTVEWPRALAGVPNRGDHVYSVDSTKVLTVIMVTHKTNRRRTDYGAVVSLEPPEGESPFFPTGPYIEVELHYDENLRQLDKLIEEREREGLK